MILLDNTVLSNFALVKSIHLLTEAFGTEISTTPQVISEFNNGMSKGRLPETHLHWLEILNLKTEEEALFKELLARVNSGEAACLAVAFERGGLILTDDRDARKLAAQLKIPISGTLGVLLRLVQIKVLSLPEGNELLRKMILAGYRSPVVKLDDL